MVEMKVIKLFYLGSKNLKTTLNTLRRPSPASAFKKQKDWYENQENRSEEKKYFWDYFSAIFEIEVRNSE